MATLFVRGRIITTHTNIHSLNTNVLFLFASLTQNNIKLRLRLCLLLNIKRAIIQLKQTKKKQKKTEYIYKVE